MVQMSSGRDRDHNVERALALVDQAVQQGAEFVVLPEYMTYLGPYEGFAGASETIPGPTCERLAAKARQHGIYLHGGSLIEVSPRPDRFYNSSVVFDPQGRLIAHYRKIHLFDVDVPGGVTDTESSTVLSGETLVTVDVAEFKVGMSICYDLRFPELYRQLAAAGAELLLVPAAFAYATGQSHWEVLLRARAIENLAYVLAPGQFGQETAGHPLYGHSMAVDPWGTVLTVLPDGEAAIPVDLDRQEVLRRREQIPVLQVRRPDLYNQTVVVGNVGVSTE